MARFRGKGAYPPCSRKFSAFGSFFHPNAPPPERREKGRKSHLCPGLDKERFGAIIFLIQLALTEKNPRSGEQRGTHSVEGSRDTRRLYHS